MIFFLVHTGGENVSTVIVICHTAHHFQSTSIILTKSCFMVKKLLPVPYRQFAWTIFKYPGLAVTEHCSHAPQPPLFVVSVCYGFSVRPSVRLSVYTLRERACVGRWCIMNTRDVNTSSVKCELVINTHLITSHLISSHLTWEWSTNTTTHHNTSQHIPTHLISSHFISYHQCERVINT